MHNFTGGWRPTTTEGKYWLTKDEVEKLRKQGHVVYFKEAATNNSRIYRTPQFDENETTYYVRNFKNQFVNTQDLKRTLTPVGSSKLRQVEYCI